VGATYLPYYWWRRYGGPLPGHGRSLALFRPGRVLLFCVYRLHLGADHNDHPGSVAVWSVLAVGLFNSIMFPTIFTLAIARLGKHTSQGSGILCWPSWGARWFR